MIQIASLLAPAMGALLVLGLMALMLRDNAARLVSLALEAVLLVCLGAALVALVGVFQTGAFTAEIFTINSAGLSLRMDAVSLPMIALVSFIGWIVLRYARTYMAEETGRAAFTGWLAIALAFVLLFAGAGNLLQLVIALIATSLCINRLLLFYPHRPAARRAARKQFITARLADAALITGAAALMMAYGTSDIAAILDAARAGMGGPLAQFAAFSLALAAIIISAQFPLHGWLTEVMEAPTPVSALLHAGVINAGGLLLIRFADVMLLSPAVLAILVMIGGFTAVFGGLVMLTQPAVKTSLAWSTVAQMGFMIMQCGFALFPLALLHILAHSLYKAHSFLASGGAVEQIAAFKRPGPVAIPNRRAVLYAFLAALSIYAVMTFAFGFQIQSPQANALGAILIFGVAYLLAQGLAGSAPAALMRRMVIYSVAASLGYFTLHTLAKMLALGTLPVTPQPGPLEWVLMVLAVISFGAVAIAQAMFPLWAYHPAAAGLRVHLSNGLYANAMLDRLLGGWAVR
ncbi:MAG: proton-conducting transporter transmembrane domain-containing protein [Erythrobacter sp.]